jgi:tetratricopeptide (TPR) repeat protein
LDLTQRIEPDDMEAAFKRAEQARKDGRFAEALDGFLALMIGRLSSLDSFDSSKLTANLTAADLVILERTGELAVLFGYDQAADDLFSGMALALKKARNFFGADYIAVKRAHLALSFGRIHDAMRLLRAMRPRIGEIEAISFNDSGLDHWEAGCRWQEATPADYAVIFSRLYLVMGWLLAALGQYEDALFALRRGLTFTGKESPDLAQRAALPLNLIIATALLEQGELQAAGNKLDELKSKIDERRQPGFHVRQLELSGKLHMLRGNFGAALDEYLNVLNTCRSHGFKKAALTAILNLSNALIFLNNTSVARELLLLAKSQAETINEPAVAARAALLIALSQARGASLGADVSIAPSVSAMRGRKRDPRPASASSEPLSEIPQSDNFLTFFEDRLLDFHWQLGQQQLNLATRLGAQLKKVFGRSDSRLISLRLQIIEAMLAYYQGELKKAEALFSQSLLPLREKGLMPELWQVQRMLGWCWSRLEVSRSKRQALAEENQRLLSSLTESLPAAYQAIFLLNKWTDEEEFIAGEINRLIALRNRYVGGAWLKKPFIRWTLMKRIHELLEYVERFKSSLAKQESDNSGNGKEIKPTTSLLQRIWSHPRDRATLSFLVLPDRVFIARLGWMTLDFGISRTTRLQIREIVRRWHALINTANGLRNNKNADSSGGDSLDSSDSDPVVAATRDFLLAGRPVAKVNLAAESRKVAEELATRLQMRSLIESLPKGVRALTIIPHDSLLGFPFAAITYQDRYIIERFNLNIAFGLSSNRSAVAPSRKRKALFVGVPQGSTQFSPLPGVLSEIKELESWAAKRNLEHCTLIGQDASKSAILERLRESAMLHIACHGVFKANQPDSSGLVLAPESGQVDILSLRDLSTLRLEELQHVSLSSCWSADNFILPGRWIIGLPETLCRAGARSVLASLWEVNDQATISFMARFYEYLNHYHKDEALRRAQLDCLHKAPSDTKRGPLGDENDLDIRDPFYWASYTLYGDYESLKL